MSSIPLPALAVKPPDQPDPLGAFQKLMALRSLANQQQIQQQTLQTNQQEQQLRQQQITDQQLTQQYLANNKDATFADAAEALKGKISVPAYTNLMDTDATIKQKHSQATQADLDNLQKVHTEQQRLYNNAVNLSDEDLAKQWPTIASQFNAIPGNQVKVDPSQPMTKAQLQQHGVALGLQENYLKQELDKRKEKAEADEKEQSAEQKRLESEFYKNAGVGAPGVPAETVSMLDWLKANPDKSAKDYPSAKAASEAKATQPYKIETALAEVKAKQLMEGMVKPGYAFDPATGTTKLTDQTAYLQSGGKLQGFRSVGEKDIKDDTMLINRLGDVHQKIAEYEQALQKPVSAKDQSNMAALLGIEPTRMKLHPGGELLGGVSLEIPMERLDAALNKENLKGLSANAREQLVAFRNAREAMLGYKTVLSGSARGSDKSMDLLTQALPDPSTTDPDFSKRSLDAFKKNLHIVGQGLPTLPGLKSPQQIEDEVWGNGGAAGASSSSTSTSTSGAFNWNSMPKH